MCVSLWIICGSIQSIQTSQRFTAVYKTLLCVGCSYIAATIEKRKSESLFSSQSFFFVLWRRQRPWVCQKPRQRPEGSSPEDKTLMTQCDFLTCSWRKRYWRWSLTPLRLTHRQETHYIIQCQRYFLCKSVQRRRFMFILSGQFKTNHIL